MKKLLILCYVLCLFTLLFSIGFADSISYQDIINENITDFKDGFIEKLGDQFTVVIPEGWKNVDKNELEYSNFPIVLAYGKDGNSLQTIEAAVLDEAEAVTFISTMNYENGMPVELLINDQKWDTWYEKDSVILVTPINERVYCIILHTCNNELHDIIRIIYSIKPTNAVISNYGITRITGISRRDYVTVGYLRSISNVDVYQFSPQITLKGFIIDWKNIQRSRMEKRISPEWARNKMRMDIYLVSSFTSGEVIDWEIGEKKVLSDSEVEFPVVIQFKYIGLSQERKYQETLRWIKYTAQLRLENMKWYILPDSLTDGTLIKTENIHYKPSTKEDQAKWIITRFLEKWKENDIEGMFKSGPFSWQKEHADDGIMERVFGGKQLIDWTIGKITVEDHLMTVQLNLKLRINEENVDSAYTARLVTEDIFWVVDIESFMDEGT